MEAPLTIIGTGHAGYTLAREFRRLKPNQPLRLITADDGASYYKPDLSKAFGAGKDARSLVRATAAEMAAQLDAEILTHTRVTALDVALHRIRAGDRNLRYDKLVLATGTAPVRLPLRGSAAGRAHSINSLEDYAAFRAALEPGEHVLIVGAGLIGSEFANDLGAAGFRVSVVDLTAWPLARFAPEAAGRAVQRALEGLGVSWHFGTHVVALEAHEGRIRATLASGEELDVDHVLTAVGVRPDLSLAEQAGLNRGQGLVVDDHLQTSAADVYALGDCMEIGGRLLPYILPIAHAARALAQTLAGKPTIAQFPHMPVIVKTPACPVILCPPPAIPGHWTIKGSDNDIEAVYRRDDETPLGFVLTGAATRQRAAFVAALPPQQETASGSLAAGSAVAAG